MLRLHRGIQKCVCALLAGALAVWLSPAALAESAAQRVARLEQQLTAQQSALESLQQQEASAQRQKENLEIQSDTLSQQVQVLAGNRSQLAGQLAGLQNTLAQTEANLADKQLQVAQHSIQLQAELDAWQQRRTDFKAQLVCLQKLNDRGPLAMVADTESLYELLSFTGALQQVSLGQTSALNSLADEAQRLADEKAALEAEQAELEIRQAELAAEQATLQSRQAQLAATQTQLNQKLAALAGNLQAADATLSTAQAQAQAQQVELDATQAAYDRAKREFDASIAALASAGGEFAGGFCWPLPSYKYITCYFGQDGHGGVDFAAGAGTPVYAAAGGTVQVATYHYGSYSYGNYIVLDHGGGYKTLYAHLSGFAVSSGSTVEQGDVIGYVGSTGYSTGNHLHFEVRVNGSRANPLGFLP